MTEERILEISNSIPQATLNWVIDNTKVKNGELKFKDRGVTVTWEAVTRRLMPLQLVITPEQLSVLTKILVDQHNQSIRDANNQDAFIIFDSPIRFCDHHMNQMGVKVAGDGTLSYNNEYAGNVPLTKGELVNKLKQELFNYNRNIPVNSETGTRVTSPLNVSELIQGATEILIAEVRYKTIGEARKSIAFDPYLDFSLNDWVKSLMDVYGIDYRQTPEHITMFKHMLYSIKRGVFNLREYERRPMYIFYSRKQGTGKTTLLEKLCTPFQYAYSETGKLGNLLRGKECKAMIRDKALIDFQELAIPLSTKNSRGEVDYGVIADIKSAITSKVIADRGMYSSENETEKQYATFASSSNMHIFDVLQDPGGMRRYWEFPLDPKQDNKTRWSQANKLFEDIHKVYRSIDEEDPYGYYHDDCKGFDKISQIQDSYAKSDAFSKFTELNKISVQSAIEQGYEPINVLSLIKRFNRWQEKQGDRAWSAKAVLALMSQKDIIPVRLEEGGNIIEVVYVKENNNAT